VEVGVMKTLWMVPFLVLAVWVIVLKSFERYSEVPVCQEQENWRGATIRSCLAYDQILAGDYRVRKGQVYWEERKYAPEKTCGFGISSLVANIFSLKCRLEESGYGRTVEYRTLTKVEKLSPSFKVLEATAPGLLDWQKEQFTKYAVGEQGVYLYGRRIKGADPKDFSVIFPLGEEEYWRFLDISRSGKSTFVGRKNLGEVDLAQFRLLSTFDCLKVNAGCTAEDLSQLFLIRGGIVGVVGNDVVALGTYDSTRFDNKASPGMYTFSRGDDQYIHTQGVLYQVSDQREESVTNSDGDPEFTVWFRRVYRPNPQNSEEFLPWQQEQFLNYTVSDDSVYFKGRRLEGADPKDFKVVFPFGPEAQWGALNLSKSGSDSFVGRWRVENADFEKLLILPPCRVSDDGEKGDCWTSQQMANSIGNAGVVAQLGEDVFHFRRNTAQRIKGAISPGFYIFMRNDDMWLSSGNVMHRFSRYAYGFDEVKARQREWEQESINSCHAPSSGGM
jgi:hypothetical protein